MANDADSWVVLNISNGKIVRSGPTKTPLERWVIGLTKGKRDAVSNGIRARYHVVRKKDVQQILHADYLSALEYDDD